MKSFFTVLLIWLVGLGAAAQFAKLGVPFSSVRELYPDAGSHVGWLLSLVSLIGVLFGMVAGMLVARYGYVRLMVLALTLGALMSFWQATLPGFELMLLSRLFEGISHLMIVVAAPTLIAQLSSDRYRGMAMALWSTFFGVSYALMAWLGLPFADHYGLARLFVVHGLYMLVLAGAVALFIRPIHESPGQPGDGVHLGAILKRHVDAYRSAGIAAPAVGWFFYTFTFVSLLAILPQMLPAESRNAVAGLMPLASIAVALLAVSGLLLVMRATSIVTIGFFAASAFLLLSFSGLSLPIICVGLFAVLGLVQGATFAAVPQLNQSADNRALANGAIAQMGNLGNLLGTPILLAIQNSIGNKGMLITIMLLYVVGGSAHLFLARMRAR
ncbi:MAG: MFS transporter [Stappiaceae bacterium]